MSLASTVAQKSRLVEALRTVYGAGGSGVLRIISSNVNGRIGFRDGEITGAIDSGSGASGDEALKEFMNAHVAVLQFAETEVPDDLVQPDLVTVDTNTYADHLSIPAAKRPSWPVKPEPEPETSAQQQAERGDDAAALPFESEPEGVPPGELSLEAQADVPADNGPPAGGDGYGTPGPAVIEQPDRGELFEALNHPLSGEAADETIPPPGAPPDAVSGDQLDNNTIEPPAGLPGASLLQQGGGSGGGGAAPAAQANMERSAGGRKEPMDRLWRSTGAGVQPSGCQSDGLRRLSSEQSPASAAPSAVPAGEAPRLVPEHAAAATGPDGALPNDSSLRPDQKRLLELYAQLNSDADRKVFLDSNPALAELSDRIGALDEARRRQVEEAAYAVLDADVEESFHHFRKQLLGEQHGELSEDEMSMLRQKFHELVNERNRAAFLAENPQLQVDENEIVSRAMGFEHDDRYIFAVGQEPHPDLHAAHLGTPGATGGQPPSPVYSLTAEPPPVHAGGQDRPARPMPEAPDAAMQRARLKGVVVNIPLLAAAVFGVSILGFGLLYKEAPSSELSQEEFTSAMRQVRQSGPVAYLPPASPQAPANPYPAEPPERGASSGPAGGAGAAAARKPLSPSEQVRAEAFAAMKAGEFDTAADRFLEALRMDPSNTQIRLALIRLYMAKRRYEQARSQCHIGLKMTTDPREQEALRAMLNMLENK